MPNAAETVEAQYTAAEHLTFLPQPARASRSINFRSAARAGPHDLDGAAHPCYRLPMTKTRYPRRAAGSPVPLHAGEPAGGASHAVPFSSETVSSTSRPRLILKRESKLNAPKRDGMLLALVEQGAEDNPVAPSLQSCRTPAAFVLHRRCSPVARRSLPSYDMQQNPTVCNRFHRLHAKPAGVVGALTLSRGRC